MDEIRRTRKTYVSEKIVENPYIKRRPVMGRFIREDRGKTFFTDYRFVLFFTADNHHLASSF
jgi:hypothetical protein